MLTFGGSEQGLSSQSEEGVDPRDARWDLLLDEWADPLTNTEQIVCRNVLVHKHLQKSQRTGVMSV